MIAATRKNSSRIGKPWLVVEGDYESVNVVCHGINARKRWVTKRQISEHATRAEAEREAAEWNRRMESKS